MIFKTEPELATFAETLGKTLKPPLVFELIGDVGTGKTTFAKALAKGLGIKEPVTSPSFTISNRYYFNNNTLIHYDFYRLSDPGLMSAELKEALSDPTAIVVLEWADSVANLLPKDHIKITFKILPDDSRDLTIEGLEK
ncbi:tRNA (adenosine(37)-N6)-threonylcarbamoyltransferase complex ATPase subunit type 1 TsaE [Candidatus Saccharibacteria bacterium]|nr:tRNA (adenosine(37)-N6)-threonylcarbamoyltransferase complex ATPase subunit type 1 TsaE [Candidatus Saccharibacteria bacterium]